MESKNWDIVSIGKLHREIAQGKYSERELATKIYEQNNEIKILKQSQDKKAIEELEKLKNFFLDPYIDEEMGTQFLITKDAGSIADYVLDRIKELKEE